MALRDGSMTKHPFRVVIEYSVSLTAGSESIELETQVWITAAGAERLDTFPWEHV
ncbi:hypothetical protein [Rhizobium gallicum]|uniref:hypothetical protein n=1 Tax=Rhizobium gallicum TaxID=56730 RepID=UPI001EF8A2B0|nr:hypothetical protein [Rhizobium gallicum]ULJ76721.1 hypothetical protein L2W42_30110 [Rhizobium gallicum]